MLDRGVMAWLRRDCVVTKGAVNAPTTGLLLAPADPMRFAVIISGNELSPVGIDFFNGVAVGGYVRLSPQYISLQVSEDTHGDMVCYQIYANALSGNSVASFIACAYNPRNYDIYRSLIREYLSKFGAS